MVVVKNSKVKFTFECATCKEILEIEIKNDFETYGDSRAAAEKEFKKTHDCDSLEWIIKDKYNYIPKGIHTWIDEMTEDELKNLLGTIDTYAWMSICEIQKKFVSYEGIGKAVYTHFVITDGRKKGQNPNEIRKRIESI